MIGLIPSSDDAFDDATANDDEDEDEEEEGRVVVELGAQAANVSAKAVTTREVEGRCIAPLCL